MAEIWLRGQNLPANIKTEAIFALETNFKPILATFCDFASGKQQVLLNDMAAMTANQGTDEQN